MAGLPVPSRKAAFRLSLAVLEFAPFAIALTCSLLAAQSTAARAEPVTNSPYGVAVFLLTQCEFNAGVACPNGSNQQSFIYSGNIGPYDPNGGVTCCTFPFGIPTLEASASSNTLNVATASGFGSLQNGLQGTAIVANTGGMTYYSAAVDAFMWDTLTFYSLTPGETGTYAVTFHSTLASSEGGNINGTQVLGSGSICAGEAGPGLPVLCDSENFDFGTNSFTENINFTLGEPFQFEEAVSLVADIGLLPSGHTGFVLAEVDPGFTFILPPGVTYTSASGVTYPTTYEPEPLTLTLFGAGLAGTALLRRRKRKTLPQAA